MPSIAMNIAFIALFSIAFLVISLLHVKKVKSFSTFALDRNSFGSVPIYCSILASGVGAALLMGNAERAYSSGLIYSIGWTGFSLQLLMTAWLAPRIYQWRHCLSSGEIMGKAYGGNDIRFICGAIWLLFCTGIVTAQVVAMQRVIALILPDFQYQMSLFLIVSVIIYSCLGGVRSVVSTDVLQAVVILLALSCFCLWGINAAGGIAVFSKKITGEFTRAGEHYGLVFFIMIFISFWLGDALIPISIQRVKMARNVNQARTAMILTAVCVLVVVILAGFLGSIAWMIDDTREASQTFSILLTAVPDWLGLLLIGGLLAAVMSSCDSYLNTAAVAFSNDILPAFNLNLTDKHLLLTGRLATVLIGLGAIGIAYGTNDILNVLLSTFEAWGPTLFPPLLIALFYPRLPRLFFYLPCFTGLTGLLCWKLFCPLETMQVGGLLAGIMAN